MSGIYVHIPFCKRKCLYCDFYSVGERLASWPTFVDAICREASHRIPNSGILSHPSPTTLYIGGGTPSLIPLPEFRRLSDHLMKLIGKPAEFTIEVNPDDVSPLKVEDWRASGVDRISMGIQSLVDEELVAVGRRHSASDAVEAFHCLRRSFDNISVDLMFGLPGQTMDSLSRSLDGILKLNPDHISVYSLMYEERTALTRLRDAGKLSEIPEEDSEAMFLLVNRRMREAGYERYEISNYAKPGYRSLHNSSYWKRIPYIGLGPSAHSYDGNRSRHFNSADIRKYLKYYGTSFESDKIEKETSGALYEGGKVNIENLVSVEILSDDELREEMIMTRLRTIEGLSLHQFRSEFGEDNYKRLLKSAQRWITTGHIHLPDSSSLALTDSGIMISDTIISSLF